MSTKYKATDSSSVYFITITTVGWVDIFTRLNQKNVIIDALRYCQKHKGLEIYAYVLMHSHLHLLCKGVESLTLAEIMRDFIKTFTATEIQYKKAYQLWGEEKWDELYQYFKTNDLNNWNNVNWPPFNGAKSILKKEKGNQLSGKVFDRFQAGKDSDNLGGRFASPVLNSSEGVEDLVFTYDSRALADRIQEGTYYYKFRMKDNLPSDLEFEYGEAIPWFKLPGNADQIRSNKTFVELKNDIEIIEILKFEKGKWKPQALK